MDRTSCPADIADLLREERLQALGPGSPNRGVYDQLRALTLEKMLAPHPVADRDMARACLAGLWLVHDFLDESHEISQEIHTSTGSYWHGIMHRREPDASNAAYWFRRVRVHPIFETLARDAQSLGLRQKDQRWDPFDFIDQCEKHRGSGSPEETMLRQVQQREWELLFEWCYHRAISTG